MLSASPPASILLESLSEQTDQVVFVFDLASQQFSFLNPAFEKVFHKNRKSAAKGPASLLKVVHPEDRQHVQEVYQDLLFGVIVKSVEFRLQLGNHPERWVCVRPRLLEEQGVVAGFADDISDQKQYNDTLKKYSDKKNAILNILSHDLAGPLALIQNLSSTLVRETDGGPDGDLQHTLGLIEKCSRQGMQLIQEFIKQEFLESAEAELIRRRVNLVEAVGEFMQEYLQNQQKLGKTFRYNASSDPIFLSLDDNKFMQVLNNLICNALKFTPDGGEITVSVEEKEETVLIKVADTGVGIPAKYHATIFDKFTKGRRPGIKGEPSVGLGMSIIKTIVEWHHGQIWFESRENEGTTFFIEIPK